MKDKKIIYTTGFAVILVITVIAALSKFAEFSWQTKGEIENNLSVDESNLQQEATVFNYPFKIIENDIPVPESAISYQEAANIAGEAIKYISGITDHQKTDATVEYTNKTIGLYLWKESLGLYDVNEYRDKINYNSYDYDFEINLGANERGIPFFVGVSCGVDADTGVIRFMYIEDYSKCGFDEETRNESLKKRKRKTEFNKTECEDILDSVYQFLEILNIRNKPVKYHIEENINPRGFVYDVSLLMDDGTIYGMGITNDDAIVNKGSLFYFNIQSAPEEYWDWTLVE